MLEMIATGDPGCSPPLPGCPFVTVPNDAHMGPDGPIVSSEGTLELFECWFPILRSQWRLPLALVLQNGQERLPSPGGGSRPCSSAATPAGSSAPTPPSWSPRRRRGKHVHAGRVNSARRMAYMASIGCHSVDGTGASKWRDRRLPKYVDWAAQPPQLRLTT